jgi:16S rRNA (guanine527-N7)-methyltransferase
MPDIYDRMRGEGPYSLAEPLKILDLGTGGGFPGIPLAVMFPHAHFTLCDSIGKKITFVRQAAELLGLSNLTAVCGRSTELNCKKEFQNKFDIVTARAVAPSPKICREASRFLHRKGRYIFYKTPTQAAEEAPLLASMKNMRWENTPVFELPGNAGERLFTTGIFTHN